VIALDEAHGGELRLGRVSTAHEQRLALARAGDQFVLGDDEAAPLASRRRGALRARPR
jgi:hypothetical protein